MGMSVWTAIRGAGRRSVVAAAAMAGLAPGLANADCGPDIQALMARRTTAIGAINLITRAHGGKLEPTAACPKLRALAAVEGEVVAYMVKNKEWCSLPDDLVSKMTESRTRTAGVAVKACDFAVKMKKMQEQQAQAATQQQQQLPAVRLPSGPL